MPQASYEYAVGRISQLSTKMLDAAKLRRIYEAGSFQEALALLLETGYGGNLSPEQLATEEIDYVIREQLQISRRIVWEVTPAPELTSLFLLEVDGHNLKTLLKARLLGVEAPDVLIDGGSFPLEQLKECVATSNYEPLPKVYRDTLNRIEAEVARGVDPLKLSAEIDGAMFRHIKNVLDDKHDHSFVRDYFSLQADFQNARSVVRARLLNWDVDKLRLMLLEGGEIDFNVFLEGMDTPMEQLGAKFNRGKNGKLISQSVEEYVTTGDASVLKRKMETAEIRLAGLMGFHPTTQYKLVGNEYGNFALPALKNELSQLEWLALVNRPELRIYDLQTIFTNCLWTFERIFR
jgi:V/A-type H+-transporting ATPase subunit C